MYYHEFQYEFTWIEVEEILKGRLEAWTKNVRTARKEHTGAKSISVMKYLLQVYLSDYVSFRVNRLGQFEETELERLAREELEK